VIMKITIFRIIGILSLFSVLTFGQDLVFLHWNDFHSNNLPYTPPRHNPDKAEVGGAAFLDAYLDSLQHVYPQALRIHAGDDFQGTPVSAVTKGYSQIEILNLIKPDFFVIGNHEFDYGWQTIQNYLKDIKFPIYGGNLVDEKNGKPLLPLTRILNINGEKVALIGVTTYELETLVIKENLAGIKVIHPNQTVKKELERLKNEGVSIFVAVTHQGLDNDIKLAEAVPELDLIIGGHSHTYLSRPKMVGKTRIVQAASAGRYIGVVTFDIENGEMERFDYKLEEVRTAGRVPSADVAALVEKQEAALRAELDVVIGTLKKDWQRRGIQSNIGQWQAEAMRQKMRADLAFQNNGGIRKDMQAGEIKVRDIWEISPFSNTMNTFTLTGQELLNILNKMAQSGNFMQMAGISFTFHENDKKVSKVKIGNKNLNLKKRYTVVTNNYVISQSDKYFDWQPKDVKEHNTLDRDILIEAVKQQKVISGELLETITVQK
jgi:5'-nucleotidase / UDP-sugar diphosphatase